MISTNKLTEMYNKWGDEQNLQPLGCALEEFMGNDKISETDRDWLKRFIDVWEYAQKKEDSKIEKVTDEELNKLLTEEVMDYWLGDATNKQARINLFCECKYDSELLESVLDHYVGGHDLKEIHNEVWSVLNRSDYF